MINGYLDEGSKLYSRDVNKRPMGNGVEASGR